MSSSAKPTNETALLWWLRVVININVKLYGPALQNEFWRDHLVLVRGIRRFRDDLHGRGWDVPNVEQERLIGLLVVRCRKYLLAKADPQFVAGYFGKALHRYVEELADDLNARFKRFPGRLLMSPEARAKLDDVLLKAALESLKTRWKEAAS